MDQYTASVTIVKRIPTSKKTALGAVKAAFNAKKYRVEIYQNGTSLLSFYAKDEAEAAAETKNMIARLKRRYQ